MDNSFTYKNERKCNVERFKIKAERVKVTVILRHTESFCI